MRFWIIFSLLPGMWLLSSCTSLSSFQTARTLPPQTGRVSLGIGYLLTSETQRPVGVSSLGTSLGELPLLDIAFRTGVEKYIDLGAKLAFPGTLTLDGKYQFYDHSLFAGAVGLGISYVALSSTVIEENKGVRNHYFDLFFPFYGGADFTRHFGIYCTPLFMLRKDIFAGSSISTLLGTSLGIRLGDKKGIFLEANYLHDLNLETNAVQINLAYFFGSGSSLPDYNFKPPPPPQVKEPNTKKEGKVLRFFPKTKSITITHPALGNWRVSDRVCVVYQREKMACGTIIKVRTQDVLVKLNFVKIAPFRDALVVLDK